MSEKIKVGDIVVAKTTEELVNTVSGKTFEVVGLYSEINHAFIKSDNSPYVAKQDDYSCYKLDSNLSRIQGWKIECSFIRKATIEEELIYLNRNHNPGCVCRFCIKVI